MPLEELVAGSTGIESDDFQPREQAYGDDIAEGRWARLDFVDRGQTLLGLEDVDADICAYKGKVTQFGTSKAKLLARRDLPTYVGRLLDELIDRGFVLEQQTPGDFLRTSTDEPILRDAYFVRGDFGISLSLTVPPGMDKYGLHVSGWSNGACLPPAQLEDHRRALETLNRDVPRVTPTPP